MLCTHLNLACASCGDDCCAKREASEGRRDRYYSAVPGTQRATCPLAAPSRPSPARSSHSFVDALYLPQSSREGSGRLIADALPTSAAAAPSSRDSGRKSMLHEVRESGGGGAQECCSGRRQVVKAGRRPGVRCERWTMRSERQGPAGSEGREAAAVAKACLIDAWPDGRTAQVPLARLGRGTRGGAHPAPTRQRRPVCVRPAARSSERSTPISWSLAVTADGCAQEPRRNIGTSGRRLDAGRAAACSRGAHACRLERRAAASGCFCFLPRRCSALFHHGQHRQIAPATLCGRHSD
jgi:hypothetical protein